MGRGTRQSSTAARIVTAVTCVALTALVAGCGKPGHAVAGELDVRTLDAGSYPVNRYTYNQSADGKGAVLEGIRMADAVVPGVKVDESVGIGRGGVVLPSVKDVISVSHLSNTAKPVLDSRGFLTGFATSSTDLQSQASTDEADPKATTVTIRLLRMSSADNAKLAAREIEDADFNVALDQNRKLTLTEYPDAYMHWRPGVANIGAVMAHQDFVISLFITRPKSEQADLLSWVRKTLDAEVPALDAFHATAADQLEKLPVDRDRMLARVLTDNRDNHTPDPDTFAVFGPSMLIHPAGEQALRQRLVDDTDMDAMAIVGDNYAFRTRDARASADLVSGLISGLGETNGTAPDKVPDTKCVTHKTSSKTIYRCYVVYKRYVGVVNADNEAAAHKAAAAQYALLANSL
ncbi:DUF7373 family lipoprotein [Nocardia inohanensis]|uniref:DUF7373 family lipoprotein n=1 Tax=Nocardia inohanensis TaxID=209246 RepID=UPI0008326958|nr:hypothetical protein [Nocardia inohanensis]